MKNLRASFIFLFVSFFCLANSNPLLGFFDKRSDDKTEARDLNEKAASSIPSTAKSLSEAVTTHSPSSCGGLKDFFHICSKNEPSEPLKSVKTRSVPEKDLDESSDDSKSENVDENKSEDDDDRIVENLNEKEKKQEITEASSTFSEPIEGGVAKRQVEDREVSMLGEVPPMISDPMEFPEKPIENPEEDKVKEKRQVEDSDSNSSSDEDKAKEKRQVEDSDSNSSSDEDKTEEILEGSRRRRNCTDSEGKNCRRKREFVPACFEMGCKNGKKIKENK